VRESWYRIAFAGAGTAPVVVVAPGQHLGEALDIAAKRLGNDVHAIAAARASAGEVPLGESVGKGVVVERGPAPELPVGFRWPRGVLPAISDAARGAAAVEGWTPREAHGIGVVEVQVSGERVIEVFLDLIERLPVADNLEIKVHGHHDDAGVTEVWLSPHLDVKRAIHFLDDHDVELLENGHVDVSVYLRGERSTLRLTEHKTLVWMAEEPAHVHRFTGWLRELKIPARAELVTAADLDHFHYRPAKSSARGRLLDRLRRMRLRKVDAWSDAA